LGTVESLSFFQKPLEPTAFEIEGLELLENTALINLGIVSKLSAFYERKDDGVFETSEDGPDPIKRERILGEHIVGLHVSLAELTRAV
jgi:hypothetical protein